MVFSVPATAPDEAKTMLTDQVTVEETSAMGLVQAEKAVQLTHPSDLHQRLQMKNMTA